MRFSNHQLSAQSLLCLILISVTPCLPAQSGGNYDLTWNSIDSGGLILYGNGYELAGTIGQPDAALLTGGNYTLSGGFLQDAASFPLPVSLSRFILE